MIYFEKIEYIENLEYITWESKDRILDLNRRIELAQQPDKLLLVLRRDQQPLLSALVENQPVERKGIAGYGHGTHLNGGYLPDVDPFDREEAAMGQQPAVGRDGVAGGEQHVHTQERTQQHDNHLGGPASVDKQQDRH